MFLTDEKIKEIQVKFDELGITATEDFVRHFFDYTEEELKHIEKYLFPA